MLVAPARRGRARRTARDWIADILIFLLASVVTLALSMMLWTDPAVPPPVALADQVVGALACAALWLRRRWPAGLALALVPFGTFSLVVAAAVCVAVFTVVVYRPFRIAGPVVALHLLTTLPYTVLRPDPDLSFWGGLLVSALLFAVLVAWGLFARARRQLVLSLRERVERAEVEAALREERARSAERERIAREMHDVLAHRISLLSLYAGGIEYRPDAPPEQIHRAAATIRAGAHQALEDLREVIGVLRGGAAEAEPERPQPTLADVRGLVEECREAGMRITLTMPGWPGEPPGGLGRNAYRIVQEGLTNARKHAPEAPVGVCLSGGAGEGLTVEVRNALSAGPPARAVRSVAVHVGDAPASGNGLGRAGLPGSGTGLIGLAERVGLAGGRLEHGPFGGDFRLLVWLPWPA
ncbi:sensor histidine kinase [Microbispora sp. RL4-1S]|uniref:histidine kinase n=2 Tax=Microbispora oryzae TaxID=2806554 RepID=A0A940WBL3_9ACTN|nr:sensor histidine kinase [Microbispora oryzae]